MDSFDNDATENLGPSRWEPGVDSGPLRPPDRHRVALLVVPLVIAVLGLAVLGGWYLARRGGTPQQAAAVTGSPTAPAVTGTGTAPPTTEPASAPVTAAPPVSGAPTSAAPVGATSAAGVPRCHTGDLTVAWGGANGAAGTSYAQLVFTNTSGHTCRMYGFPGMEPVDAGGAQILVKVVRTGDQPHAVTIGPHMAAWALVHWSQVDGTYAGAACTPGASGLVVTPPDETTSLRLTGTMRVCGDGTITTGPVVDHPPI